MCQLTGQRKVPHTTCQLTTSMAGDCGWGRTDRDWEMDSRDHADLECFIQADAHHYPFCVCGWVCGQHHCTFLAMVLIHLSSHSFAVDLVNNTIHGSPVSAISYSLVDRLTPIALSLTPGHAWHSSVASGTSGNWAFFVITCACRSCSILWQFQLHAVAKPRFLTAWMLVCLLVQSLLF